MTGGPFSSLDKYKGRVEPPPDPPEPAHVHDANCWQFNHECAKYWVRRLTFELSGLKTKIAVAQLEIREAGARIDKADQGLDRALNPGSKK